MMEVERKQDSHLIVGHEAAPSGLQQSLDPNKNMHSCFLCGP